MSEFDGTTFVGEDGTFTESFTEALPSFLGKETLTKDDGTPIKMFENTPNMASLVKMAYDSKTAMGKKLENVIQKPGEDASDEEKAEFMKQLDIARGVPGEDQEYNFPLLEGQEEEDMYSEDQIKAYKDFARAEGIPAATFEKFVTLNRTMVASQIQAQQEAEQAAEQEVISAIKKQLPGETLAVGGKQVFNALTKFNRNNPEFTKTLKESGVFEDPTNFETWKKAGVSPASFRAWHSIAQELKISHAPGGGGTPPANSMDHSDLLPNSAKSFKPKS